jgi:hypothetical protein
MTMKGDTSLRADGMIGRLPDSSIVTKPFARTNACEAPAALLPYLPAWSRCGRGMRLGRSGCAGLDQNRQPTQYLALNHPNRRACQRR